ncbi:MAG: DMT family transporter [Clostridia bacterium]|nr:DMT family transporter [Clostridia bacterium]
MMKTKNSFIYRLILFISAVAWGSTFLIMKETVKQVPLYYTLGIRFLPAGLIIMLIFIKKFGKNFNKKALLHGVIVGLILAVAYTLQSTGLTFTTPARNSFLNASYCVLTPFMAYFINKKKLKSHNVVSAVMCIIGVALVALSSSDDTMASNALLGDTLTLISAIFYALQLIFLKRYQKSDENENGDDGIVLLVVELVTVGLYMFILSFIVEFPTRGIQAYALNLEQILKIGYLMAVCTLGTQLAIIVSLDKTSENQASLILSLEAVFGTLISVIFGGEELTLLIVIGFVIIFIAELIAELKIDVFKPFRKLKE